MKYKFEADSEWEATHLMHAINYRMEVDDLRNEIRSHLKHGKEMTIDKIYDELMRLEGEYPIRE